MNSSHHCDQQSFSDFKNAAIDRSQCTYPPTPFDNNVANKKEDYFSNQLLYYPYNIYYNIHSD